MTNVLGSAGGGKFTPAKPVLTYNSKGKFNIVGYESSYTYTLSVTAGTATRSGSVVTLSNADSTCTVIAVSPRGLSSTSSTFQRKSPTYTYYNCVYKDPGSMCNPGQWRGDYGWTVACCDVSSNYPSSPPSGFSVGTDEFYKIG